MKKYFKYLMMVLVAAVAPISLVSCGEDKDDEPQLPNTDVSEEIISGTTGFDVWHYIYYFSSNGDYLRFQFSYDNHIQLYVGYLYSPTKIVYVGKSPNLKSIKQAPTSGWDDTAEIVDGGGYIISYVKWGVAHYIRMVITTNKIVTGEITGITYSYQEFTPSNV